uniref:Phospholipid/glycerol acyltransferase domain-containing protein n=3 Tax=Parascaris univalens TaxID=6257 RepID=A0A915C8T6_PARUN
MRRHIIQIISKRITSKFPISRIDKDLKSEFFNIQMLPNNVRKAKSAIESVICAVFAFISMFKYNFINYFNLIEINLQVAYITSTMEFPSVRGTVFCLLLFLTSLLGSIFILVPFAPLVYIAPRWWRYYVDRFVGYWLTFPASLCDFIFGVEFHISGDLIERDAPALIVMNHRTRLDWLFFWNALYKIDPWLLITEKISLKAPLKLIPGAGWAMECGGYIFLKRNLENDMHVMDTMITYYSYTNQNYQLLLFPEGTDRSERAAFLSDVYAEKNSLPKYKYVLHPRTAGFIHLLRLMRRRKYISYVYDVTVGYPKGMVISEMELLMKGRFPKEVHFDIKRYNISEVPLNEMDAAAWLSKLWREKERRLEHFYTTNEPFAPSGARFLWPVSFLCGIG